MTADEISQDFTHDDLIEYIAYIGLKNEIAKDPVNIYPKKERIKRIKNRVKGKLNMLFKPEKARKK